MDFDRHNYLTHAAALAFFFLLSLFPLLIFIASVMAFLPVPNFFEQILEVMSRVVPPDAMGVVSRAVRDVLATNRGLLSAGIVGAIWAASGGFNAMIGALNIAYDVKEGRPFWKRRLVALGLAILIGAMVIVALVATVAGPQFGAWLASRVRLDPVFAIVWPYLRWGMILGFTILSVETLYFLGPNVRQRFWLQVPGAVIAVAIWIVVSSGLGWYVSNFANFNRTYGVLGAPIALMLWLYLSALAILIGAELNAEWAKSHGEQLAEKEHAVEEPPQEELEVA